MVPNSAQKMPFLSFLEVRDIWHYFGVWRVIYGLGSPVFPGSSRFFRLLPPSSGTVSGYAKAATNSQKPLNIVRGKG